jgi:anti-anti-sigma regulatory factor
MLRIHIEEQCKAVTIRLEGRLSGPWVTELDRCWQHTLARPSNKTFVVALEAVTFVDGAGQQLLQEMQRGGASLSGKGMWSRHLVEQIRQGAS